MQVALGQSHAGFDRRGLLLLVGKRSRSQLLIPVAHVQPILALYLLHVRLQHMRHKGSGTYLNIRSGDRLCMIQILTGSTHIAGHLAVLGLRIGRVDKLHGLRVEVDLRLQAVVNRVRLGLDRGKLTLVFTLQLLLVRRDHAAQRPVIIYIL